MYEGRKEGTTQTVVKIGLLRMVVECLAVSGDTTVMAFGITQQKDSSSEKQ